MTEPRLSEIKPLLRFSQVTVKASCAAVLVLAFEGEHANAYVKMNTVKMKTMRKRLKEIRSAPKRLQLAPPLMAQSPR